eukprot:6478971-Prymnesium_polylepis.2
MVAVILSHALHATSDDGEPVSPHCSDEDELSDESLIILHASTHAARGLARERDVCRCTMHAATHLVSPLSRTAPLP